uniref:Uncharacterized protein n=1 Tax=Setaria digitata TaxID=48799 RepID=A0A915PT53_9BILA
MEGVTLRSRISDDDYEFEDFVERLFGDESIFPRMVNFFMGDISSYCPDFDVKLRACKRPLNLFHLRCGARVIDKILNSPWVSTLTDLHLGYCIESGDYQYIGSLHNLKVFSSVVSFSIGDDEFAPIKNLSNLEELRINCSGEECELSNDGMISLFTLPPERPEKSFPYKLQCLELSDFHACRTSFLQIIDRNCPNLRMLNLSFNKYMGDDAVPFIVSHFKKLAFLDLSNLGECYKDEVWNDLYDDDLPDLRLLKIHGNKINMGNLQRFNLKRPKLLISAECHHVINWTVTESGCVFHDSFNGDFKALENDLRKIDGLRDFRLTVSLPTWSCYCSSMVRSSSYSVFETQCVQKLPFSFGTGSL